MSPSFPVLRPAWSVRACVLVLAGVLPAAASAAVAEPARAASPDAAAQAAAQRQDPLQETVVVGVAPADVRGIDVLRIPARVHRVDANDLAEAQRLDLAAYLDGAIGSVAINSAQGNPLQPDVQYRGFTASPLLGLAQGIAVYQDGARINEPFGDAVNWDLVPQSAIASVTLTGGASPLFGLNTLGGALTIRMKDGFAWEGLGGELAGGSWRRAHGHVEAGGNDGRWGYYVNANGFREDGWRDLSDSDAAGVYASASYRGDATTADVAVQRTNTRLTGNGPLPVGFLERDRNAVFTAPDRTRNELRMFTLQATHAQDEQRTWAASAFSRRLQTRSLNGDVADFTACALGNGERLLEGLEDEVLADAGVAEEDVCDGSTHADAQALEDFLRSRLSDADTPGDVHIQDLTAALSGSGVIEDDAVNNRSTRRQSSHGGDLLLTDSTALFGHGNQLLVGFGYVRGDTDFDARVELAGLDAGTRSTEGLGTGTFLDSAATSIATHSRSASIYFSNSFALDDRITLTVGGRYDRTHIRLRDRSGERPELNGRHRFARLNPSFGVTWQADATANLYASYAESARAPTPIELACNEGVFEIARANAEAAGEDPDDIDFECRLPNAFLADPPLRQVVARSVEAGVRGELSGIEYHLGVFSTTSEDDILFQTTGRATGLFANVDETRRRGVELALSGEFAAADGAALAWSLSYSFLDATFRTPFSALSPNHPGADEDGEVQVARGDRIPGLPRHGAKFALDYTFAGAFARGIAVGADLQWRSGQYMRGDESNDLGRIDGHAVVNVHARVPVGEHVEAFLRVDNLFDAEYENFGVVGDDPSELLPGLQDTRPYILGVGAPRAAWVGVRVAL